MSAAPDLKRRQAAITNYWRNTALNPLLASQGIDVYGLPEEFARHRHRLESRIMAEILGTHLPSPGNVLDLGSGEGSWSAFFAEKGCASITALEVNPRFVEHSARLLNGRVARLKLENRDVNEWRPQAAEHYDLIFAGGLLMYQEDENVVRLLDKIRSVMGPASVFLCRESVSVSDRPIRTPAEGCGAFYRKPETYVRLFAQAGLALKEQRRNTAYDEQVLLLIPGYWLYALLRIPHRHVTPWVYKLMRLGIYNLDLLRSLMHAVSLQVPLTQRYFTLHRAA